MEKTSRSTSAKGTRVALSHRSKYGGVNQWESYLRLNDPPPLSEEIRKTSAYPCQTGVPLPRKNMFALFNFKNTRLSFKRPIGSYSKVRILYSYFVRNRKFQLRRLDSNKKPYLNVGCGMSPHPQFINLDRDWWPGIDIVWDTTRRLPFADSTFLGIFSEHCLEHIPLEDCRKALREFRRILKPEGTLRVIVPDTEIYLDVYRKRRMGERISFPYEHCKNEDYIPVKDTLTPMMQVNLNFRYHDHKYAYDSETLELLLRESGFHQTRRARFHEGRDQKLLIDQNWRECESLYLEAFGNSP